MPEDTTQPKAAIMASKSVHILRCPKGQHICDRDNIDHYLHVLVDVVMRSNTVNAKDDQWDCKQESKDDAQSLDNNSY
jgi:hypothetical protein